MKLVRFHEGEEETGERNGCRVESTSFSVMIFGFFFTVVCVEKIRHYILCFFFFFLRLIVRFSGAVIFEKGAGVYVVAKCTRFGRFVSVNGVAVCRQRAFIASPINCCKGSQI